MLFRSIEQSPRTFVAFEDEKEKAGILSETYLSTKKTVDEAQTSLCYLKVISRPHLEIVKDVN